MKIATSLSLGLLFVAGCGGAEFDARQTGTVTMPLRITGDDGAPYTLFGAITIRSGNVEVTTLDLTNADSTVTAMTVELPAGEYTAELTGWVLMQPESSPDGNYFVDAVLASLNPWTFRVRPNSDVQLHLQFFVRRPDGDVTVSFGIDPTPRIFSGTITELVGHAPGYEAYDGDSVEYQLYFEPEYVFTSTTELGTKDLRTQTGKTALEFFFDDHALMSEVASRTSGHWLDYVQRVHPDGAPHFELAFGGGPIDFLLHGTNQADFPIDQNGFPLGVDFSTHASHFELIENDVLLVSGTIEVTTLIIQ